MANIYIARVFYAILVILNVLVPVYAGKSINTFFAQYLVLIFWGYAILSQAGIFKVPVPSDVDDDIHYEANVPLLQVGLTRILEAVYFAVLKGDVVNWKVFIVYIVLDALFASFLLMDKSRYYFEMGD